MRKLTGYIGAMIIVIALMGSILAGYALNINGSTAVMNEYEKVTDVSGLYTHTQEPAYIEYNPASNYIGYQNGPTTYYNPQMGANDYHYRSLTGNTVYIDGQTPGITIDGVSVGAPTGGIPQYAFICDYFYLYYEYGTSLSYYSYSASYSNLTNARITINNGTVIVQLNDNPGTITYNNTKLCLSYNDYPNYDYRVMLYGEYANQNIYVNNEYQIIRTTNGPYGIAVGNSWLNFNDGTTTTKNFVISTGQIDYDVYAINVQNENIPTWGVFYPRAVNSTSNLGINYTESNRVNNYPIETDYSTITGTSTESLDLMTISAANQSNGTWVMDHSGGFYNSGSVETYWMANDYISYKLSDIIPVLTPPANTKTIRFIHDIDYYQNWVYFYDVNGNSDNRVELGYHVPYNSVSLNQTSWANAGGVNKTIIWSLGQNYVDYNVDTGLCDCFDSYGNKYRTATPSELCFSFIPSTATTSTANLYVSGQYNYQDSVTYPIGSRPHPTINIVYTTTGTITDVHYSDITKGYSIKDTNGSNTVWNNEYTNGNIQLLFRAEGTPGYYHNDVTIGSNNISIDYNQNRYVVTLNSNDPVDIGTWRNIILDVDLINGKLSAIPVRTFNSFTNVVTENTKIFIGDLVGATPTNTIEWGPTPNSLLFNVYSTSVFMNTYGIVMMNPTLNITNYFTDLDNFYQLRLSGFSVYGQSMTVNGVTGTVTGNTITFNNETVQVKDMEITYADGHAYISDSYATIDLGAIVDNNVSMTGAWYFVTDLYDGYTTQKMVYDWDWEQFILDDKAFGVIYIGLCLIGLIVARHFCTLTVTDYIIFVVSIVFALTVPVIA